MLNLTQSDITMVRENFDFVQNNMGVNELIELENRYKDLCALSEGINTCLNATSKIGEINKMIKDLQTDTINVCNSIAYLVDNANVVSNN